MHLIERLHARFTALEPAERALIKIGAMCVCLFLIVGALGIALSAKDTASSATTSVRGSCQFWRDLSQVPLSPASGKPLLTIIADARIAYARQGCANLNGQLPAPDPRVKPFLPVGLR